MTFFARGVCGNLPTVTISGPLWTSFSTSSRIFRRSTSRFFRTLAATPDAFFDQSKQNVLGADVFVVEPLSLLVGQLHDLAGAVCKSFVHSIFLSVNLANLPKVIPTNANGKPGSRKTSGWIDQVNDFDFCLWDFCPWILPLKSKFGDRSFEGTGEGNGN